MIEGVQTYSVMGNGPQLLSSCRHIHVPQSQGQGYLSQGGSTVWSTLDLSTSGFSSGMPLAPTPVGSARTWRPSSDASPVLPSRPSFQHVPGTTALELAASRPSFHHVKGSQVLVSRPSFQLIKGTSHNGADDPRPSTRPSTERYSMSSRAVQAPHHSVPVHVESPTRHSSPVRLESPTRHSVSVRVPSPTRPPPSPLRRLHNELPMPVRVASPSRTYPTAIRSTLPWPERPMLVATQALLFHEPPSRKYSEADSIGIGTPAGPSTPQMGLLTSVASFRSFRLGDSIEDEQVI